MSQEMKTALVQVTEYLVTKGWPSVQGNPIISIMEVEVYDEHEDAAEVAMEEHRMKSYFVPSDKVVYGRTGKSYRKFEESTGFTRYYKFEEF